MNTIKFDDLDAEKELIAIFCTYPDYLKQMQRIISPDIFQYNITKASYLACIELLSEKGRIMLQDLILRLKTQGNNDWISMMDINSFKNPIDAQEIVQYLGELKAKKDLYQLSKKVEKSLLNGQSVDDIISEVNSVVGNDLIKNDNEEILDMQTALKISLEDIGDVMTNGKTSGVPTGYPTLDNICGGWQNSEMIIFAGRPGQGKSISLLEHTRHASRLGFPVLFLSLEMPVKSLVNRMISGSLEDGTPYSKINTGRINIETFEKISNKAVTELAKLPITWYDGANRDINYLTNVIQRIVKEKNIKMVCIDYLQLMTDNRIKSNDDTATVASVSRKLQQLAKKLKIPFVCAAQLNRGTESRTNHRPRLSDLKQSGQIEQDASTVIGLYREDYYSYERAKEQGNGVLPEFNNTIEYIFLKNRNGDTRTLDLYIDCSTSTIKEFKEELPNRF